MWKAQWKSDYEWQGSSPAELDAILDDLHTKCDRNQPILAAVESINGDTLTIGLGSELSLLSFVQGNGKPPYLSSVGNCHEDGVSVFYYMGEWTEIPKRRLIPLPLARQAMRSFIVTGKIPNNVNWEED